MSAHSYSASNSAAFVAFLVSAPATAQGMQSEVYFPANGFWLRPSNHSPSFYGPTSPGANWNIAQWDIPADLPVFNKNHISANRWAFVRWQGNGRYELSQDATALACEKAYPSGQASVNEFDLFASPNNDKVRNHKQASGDAGKPLSGLDRIDAGISVEIVGAEFANSDCRTSLTAFIFAVVLSNSTSHQYLFYQIRLANFAKNGNAVRQQRLKPGFFFSGMNTQSGKAGQWGFGDNVDVYSQPFAQVGVRRTYRINLLPRLRWVIAQGSRRGLDQNLANWDLTGTYHGQSAMGHVRNDAIWGGFSLRVR